MCSPTCVQVVVKYRKAQLKVMMTGLSLNNGTDAFVAGTLASPAPLGRGSGGHSLRACCAPPTCADMGMFLPSTNVSVMTTKESGLRVTGNASYVV